MNKNKNNNKNEMTIVTNDEANKDIQWSKSINKIELPKSIKNQGFESGLSIDTTSIFWKPMSKLNVDKPLISIDTSIQEDIFKSNPEEISELQQAVLGVIQGYSQSDSKDDMAAIKQAAIALDVYHETLQKFVEGNQISTPNFNRLLKKLTNLIIDSSHEKGNVVDLVNSISNPEVDAILVDYWYNPLSSISKYKSSLKGGISYIQQKWTSYWNEFSSDPIDQINLIDRQENQSDFYKKITENEIQVHFALLPKYMWRIAQNKKIKHHSRIGIFFIVAGWSDFLEHNEIIKGLNLKDSNNTVNGKISEIKPSFNVKPNFSNLIFKE